MATNDETRAAERLVRFAEIAMQGTPSQAPAYHDAAHMQVYNGTPHSRLADLNAVARAYLEQRAELAHLRAEVADLRKPVDVADECTAIGPHHRDRCSGGRIQSPNAQFTEDCRVCSGSGRSVPSLLEEVRRLRAANAELEAWKREQSAVASELDTQTVGKLLGVPLGQSIYAAIEPGIRRLIEANAELAASLRKELNELMDRNRCSSHWDGCESNHPICAAIERIRAALARHDAGKGGAAS